MTFREDRTPGSSTAGERSQTDDSFSPASQRQGPPDNVDPALGRVDWDEIEAQNIQLGLRGALRDLGIKPPGE
jgi:hypothetical protein